MLRIPTHVGYLVSDPTWKDIKTVKDQVRRTLPTFLLAKFLTQFGEDVRQALFGERFHGEAVTLKETGHRFVCFEGNQKLSAT